MFEINRIAIENALNQFNSNEHPLISPLGPALNQPDPAPRLKAWLRNDYNQAKPQDKEQFAPLARRIALELIQPNHYQRVTTAFKELYPRVPEIYGQTNLSEDEFLNGDYYVYMEDANPTIVKMPRAANSTIPKIKKLEDVPAAMAALESTSMQEDKDETGLKNLNTHAKKMSARSVVALYKIEKPQTKDDFSRFIKDLPHRFSRVGFTGEPYSEVNAMLAQIAWACEPSSQEKFWKILYPEITGVVDGDSNTLWPRYGEAILSESLAQKTPGPILNYRQLWEKAETAPIDLIEATKVSGFCPAHRDYWLEVVTRRKNGSANHPESKLVFKTEFSNYYEFFESMRDFMDAYKATNENGWEDDIGSSPEGLQAMLDFRAYQEVILNAPPALKALFRSIDLLPEILNNVAGEIINKKLTARINLSCFASNSQSLRTLLAKKKVQEVLSEIKFTPKSIAFLKKDDVLIEGHDALFYLPEHTGQLGALSEDSLIELIKQHEALGLALSVLSDLYRPLFEGAACKHKKLFNTVYQINDMGLGTRFIQLVLGALFTEDKLLEQESIEAVIYELKLLELMDLPQQEKNRREKVLDESLNNRFNLMSSALAGMEKFEYFDFLQLYHFLKQNKKALKEINALMKISFEGQTQYQKQISSIKSKIHDIYDLSSREFRKLVKDNIIKALVFRETHDLKKPVVTQQIKELIDMLIDEWILPDVDFKRDDEISDMFILIETFDEIPGVRQKIEGMLTSERIYDFVTSDTPPFWINAFDLLRRRNYQASHEKFLEIFINFRYSSPTEAMKNELKKWLKPHEPHFLNVDVYYTILREMARIKDKKEGLAHSLVFELYCDELGFIQTYNDYIKVASMLHREQKTLLKEKFPEFTRPDPSLANQDFDQVPDFVYLYYLLDFALDDEKSRVDLSGYFNYFKKELDRLLRCDNEDCPTFSLQHSSSRYLPSHYFRDFFEKMVSFYGLDETLLYFTPHFVSYLNDNPYEVCSFLWTSSYQKQVCELLSRQDLTFSVLSKNFYGNLNLIFDTYPGQRQRMFEEVLAHRETIDQKVIMRLLPRLSSDQLKLFLTDDKMFKVLEETIKDSEAPVMGRDHLIRDPVDFIARLCEAVDMKELFRRSTIRDFILRKKKGFDENKIASQTQRPLYLFRDSSSATQGLEATQEEKPRSTPN
jgi:hypothetical protein